MYTGVGFFYGVIHFMVLEKTEIIRLLSLDDVLGALYGGDDFYGRVRCIWFESEHLPFVFENHLVSPPVNIWVDLV